MPNFVLNNFPRQFVNTFATNMVRTSVLDNLPQAQTIHQENSTSVGGASVVPRFPPGDRFCELSFRYLSPGREGEECRPLRAQNAKMKGQVSISSYQKQTSKSQSMRERESRGDRSLSLTQSDSLLTAISMYRAVLK